MLTMLTSTASLMRWLTRFGPAKFVSTLDLVFSFFSHCPDQRAACGGKPNHRFGSLSIPNKDSYQYQAKHHRFNLCFRHAAVHFFCNPVFVHPASKLASGRTGPRSWSSLLFLGLSTWRIMICCSTNGYSPFLLWATALYRCKPIGDPQESASMSNPSKCAGVHEKIPTSVKHCETVWKDSKAHRMVEKHINTALTCFENSW